MDDMAEKITSLLSDPDGMEKIKGMAEALFGENKPAAPPPQSGGGLSLPEGFDPAKLMGVFSALSKSGGDDRTALLLALKPHLAPERRERVDKAVKLLKIASLLPVLRDEGLLDMLGI